MDIHQNNILPTDLAEWTFLLWNSIMLDRRIGHSSCILCSLFALQCLTVYCLVAVSMHNSSLIILTFKKATSKR